MNRETIGVEVEDVFIVTTFPQLKAAERFLLTERTTYDTYELAREAGFDAIALEGANEFTITKITRVVPRVVKA